MRQDERLDGPEPFPRRPSPPLVGIGGEHDRQLDRTSPHRSLGPVDVSEWHVATDHRETALVLDQLVVQVAGLRVLDNLRLERAPPSVDRQSLLGGGLGLAPFDGRDLLDHYSKPSRVVHEAGARTLALVQRRLRHVRFSEQSHVSRPECVLLRPVEPLELVVQAVEEPLQAAW